MFSIDATENFSIFLNMSKIFNKPTVHDIAKAAGVSLATIDRVLNERAGVRQKTIDKVNEAIKEIGYVRDVSAANLARGKSYRFVFLLPDRDGEFINSIKNAVEESNQFQANVRISAEFAQFPANNPHELVKILNELGNAGVDGIAIMAPETPQLRDAISHLRERNISVVALVSDLPNTECNHFVGIDNTAAGRTAATLIGRFSSNKKCSILVISETMQLRDSLERRLGFDAVMNDKHKHLTILPTLETYNNDERTDQIIGQAFARNPSICGVYIMGSVIKPVISAIQKSSADIQKLIIVSHELTTSSRQSLMDDQIDAIITQNVGHLVRSTLRLLKADSDGIEAIASQEKIRIEIALKENIE